MPDARRRKWLPKDVSAGEARADLDTGATQPALDVVELDRAWGSANGSKSLPSPPGKLSVSTLVVEWMPLTDGYKNQLEPRSIR